MIDAALIRKYAAPVPRYTSYPTAPHFSAEIGPARHAAWLEALPPQASLSLYLHVPFCDTLCWFCGCHTKVVNRYAPVAAYFELLTMEAALTADHLDGRRPVRHVHFGGGSPTILRGNDMRRLMDHLRTQFAFEDDAEVAIEIDPRGFTEAYARDLAAAGFTRASLGVQDLDVTVQRAVNRIQSYDETARAAGALRDAGIDGINIDLMYGLPHQTTPGVAATAARVMALKPSRIALFGYAHVPWMRAHQQLIDENALPDAEARFAQARTAEAVLRDAGYVSIGLDHFAAPDDAMAQAAAEGRLRRNFQGYTTDAATALVGLGCSSISQLPGGYIQNVIDMRAYRAAVETGHLPTARGIVLNHEDRLRRAAIEEIMCTLAIDLGAHCDRFGRGEAALDDVLVRLAPMVADGLVEIDGRTVRVPEASRPFLRSVAAAFDLYLEAAAARHSTAV